MVHISTLLAYQRELDRLHKQVLATLSNGATDAHMAAGRAYHTLADDVLARYGVEMRPFD